MAKLILALALSFSSAAFAAASKIKIEQLQGVWWSSQENPTADFAILGDSVWLDFDSGYHSCRVREDTLIFDLGAELGDVRNHIVSLKGEQMVLKNVAGGEATTLHRAIH